MTTGPLNGAPSAGCTFMASVGLHALVKAVEAANERDRELTIRNAPHIVRRVIQAAGLEDVLPLRP
jgi:anti-anti-sigma factor